MPSVLLRLASSSTCLHLGPAACADYAGHPAQGDLVRRHYDPQGPASQRARLRRALGPQQGRRHARSGARPGAHLRPQLYDITLLPVASRSSSPLSVSGPTTTRRFCPSSSRARTSSSPPRQLAPCHDQGHREHLGRRYRYAHPNLPKPNRALHPADLCLTFTCTRQSASSSPRASLSCTSSTRTARSSPRRSCRDRSAFPIAVSPHCLFHTC